MGRLIVGAGTVHDLSKSQGAGAHASLEAVVTYSDPAEHLLFLQDKTGGVFVNGSRHVALTAGAVVSVEGSIQYGYRAGVSEDAQIKVLRRGSRPRPILATYRALSTGQLDCRLVRVTGMVRDAVIEQHQDSHSQPLHLDVGLDGGVVQVYVNEHNGVDPFSLMNQRVTLTGVAGGEFNAREQMVGVVLYSQQMSDLTFNSRQAPLWSTLPITDPDALFSAVEVHDDSPQLRVRGSVVYFAPGETAYLEQGGKSILVQTRQTNGVAVGDVVDAYGYPSSRSYIPSLREAVLKNSSEHHDIEATPLTFGEAMSGRYADALISIEGRVLSQYKKVESNSLTLDVEGHAVRANIQNGESLPRLNPGSVVRITGICKITTGGPWREPTNFSVLSRSRRDVLLLKNPSWWSIPHLAELLGVLLGISLSVSLWAVLLRRRVIRQGRLIEISMRLADRRGAVLEQISKNTAFDEVLTLICNVLRELLPHAKSHFQFGPRLHVIHNLRLTKVLDVELQQAELRVGEFTVFMPGKPSAHELQILTVVRELLTLASNNAELHQQLLLRSTHDSLTGLPNRRLCEERIEDLLSRSAVNSQGFCIFYIDVNHFKQVNDEFGHRSGDLYLQAIAKRLTCELRPDCTIARIGGDEFMILAPHSDAATANHILDRLNRCFSRPFYLGSVRLNGSASFGLAVYPIHGRSREELEQYADKAMYAVKFQGREADASSVAVTAGLVSENSITLICGGGAFGHGQLHQ